MWCSKGKVNLKLILRPNSTSSIDCFNQPLPIINDFWGRCAYHNGNEMRLLKLIPKSITSRMKYLTSRYSRSKEFYDMTPKHIRGPIHITLPKKSGIPTRASVSLVFAPCVFIFWYWKDLFAPRTSVTDFPMVRGIHTYFTLLQRQLTGVDFRSAGNWADLLQNARNVENLGYHKASRLARQVTNLCNACRQNRRELIEMTCEDDGISLKCPECGGKNPIVSHYSITYLKRKQSVIIEKERDIVESIPLFINSLNSLAPT